MRDVIEQAKLLMLTKNDGELLQDFIWQTSHMSGVGVSGPKPTVDKATAQQHGNEALDGLRSLGTLILSNGQFRKLRKSSLLFFNKRCYEATPANPLTSQGRYRSPS